MIKFDGIKDVLEIGGGSNPNYHPNMDIRNLPEVDIVSDLNKEWPIPNGTYGAVYSSYVIEHISWRKIRHFISETFRVLRPGGQAGFITANLRAQAEKIAQKEDFADDDLSMIFGDQNYDGEDWRANSHTCGFSPSSAQRLFQEVGFEDVITFAHPECRTDMVIIAKKSIPKKTRASIPPEAYDKDYFCGGKGLYGGYVREGYRDFPVNWNIFKAVMEMKPSSVLEIGCAKGYLLKRFLDLNLPVLGLDVSRHCYLTRAIEEIIEWDITNAPWPIKDRSFDVGLSVSTLEHIPESKIDVVISEMKRVCARGFHAINFNDKAEDYDGTHVLVKPPGWWKEKFGDGDYRICSDREFNEIVPANIPIGSGEPKLNLGSFTTMYHHGWMNMDILDLRKYAEANYYQFVQTDLSAGFRGAPSNSVELISCSHLIEHLDPAAGLNLMKECHRVLRSGGLIRLACPDTKMLVRIYEEGHLDEFEQVNDGCGPGTTNLQKLQAILYDGHKTVYDEELLGRLLRNAGFKKVNRCAFRRSSSEKILRETLDMFPCLSLYMEASKD